MPQILAVVSLAASAIGTGLSYVSSMNAAKTQETLALANAQNQRQAIEQEGQINLMQASLNATLAQKDKEAADAEGRAIGAQSELLTRTSIEATRRGREEAGQAAAQQVASLAKAGFSDTTGSPLSLLADTAEKEQRGADAIRFEDEQQRREAIRQQQMAANQSTLAGLKSGEQKLYGMASQQKALRDQSANKLNYLAQKANAAGIRSKAAGSLIGGLGNLSYQGYQMFK